MLTYTVLIYLDNDPDPLHFHYEADDALHAMEQYIGDWWTPPADHVDRIEVRKT